MNSISNHKRSNLTYLEYLLASRRRLLTDWLLEDATGRLRADIGQGLKLYGLREPNDRSEYEGYGKVQLLYDSAVSIQELLDNKERPDFQNLCDLLTFHIAAAVCLEGEVQKDLLERSEREIRAARAKGGHTRLSWTPAIDAVARPVYDEAIRSGCPKIKACARAAGAVHRTVDKAVSVSTCYRHLKSHEA